MFDPNKVIRLYKEIGDVDEVAKRFGIHRSTIYRWIKKARTFSKGYLRHTGLKRLSRAPIRKRKSVLTSQERIAIIELRKNYGWCAQRITEYLKQKDLLASATSFSTVYRFLKKRGIIQEQGYRRRPRFQNTKHMHLKNAKTVGKLQMDVKYVTPQLSGLDHTVFKFAVIDIFSRFKQAVILPQLDIDHSVIALKAILQNIPFKPDFIQTDNGLEFQSRFVQFCKDQGLQHHFIHKNSPNENAVIERSFRTDEEEFYFRLPKRPQDLFELNQLYQHYLHHYNTERPHLGINCKTPHIILSQML